MPSVRAKDGHRVPLGPCFSADSAPADLWGHWSNWSLRSCIFRWGPESETASLHLARHSPSSRLLRGNVINRRGGRYRDCCKPQESSWLRSSLQEEMPGAHRAAPSSAGPQELRCDPGHSPAPQHPTPSAGGVWHLLVQTKQTLVVMKVSPDRNIIVTQTE